MAQSAAVYADSVNMVRSAVLSHIAKERVLELDITAQGLDDLAAFLDRPVVAGTTMPRVKAKSEAKYIARMKLFHCRTLAFLVLCGASAAINWLAFKVVV